MRFFNILVMFVVAGIALLSLAPFAKFLKGSAPIRIPLEVIFGNPEKVLPHISPDAQNIAYIAPLNNVLNIWVAPKENPAKAIPVTHDTDQGIISYCWAPDSQSILYVQDKQGDEDYHIYQIYIGSADVKDLTPFESVKAGIIAAHNDTLYISLNKDNPQLHDIYAYDLKTEALSLLEKNPGDVVSWILDSSYQLRAKVVVTHDGGSELWVRDTPSSSWQKYLYWDLEETGSSDIVGFNEDGTALYIIDAKNHDTNELIQYYYKSGQTVSIFHDPQYDIAGAWYDQDCGKVYGVAVNRAKAEFISLDEQAENIFKKLNNLPGELWVASSSEDKQTLVISAKNDTDPTSYYLVTLKPFSCRFLWTTRSELKRYVLAPMEPFTISASDNLKLEGYVTYPVGVARKKLPMVLNVHGGPWARDSWGCNPEAQWFANRGYICVQVNFRGSTGYGKAFLNAANREWGRKMHQDLVDTVNHFIKKGEVDPARIAIYGGSYGGYAALCGAAFTPDLFTCAIDIVGPSNIITMLRSIPPYWQLALYRAYQQIGNPDTEEDFLKSRSPLFSAHAIKIPLLIAQGANDPRVKQAESEQIGAALKEHSVPHEYILFPDEGHGFSKPENRLKFYKQAEQFLERYLK
ncbi:MAG TPA: S9 family peptidase [Candidatus Babeliaceae bacterium]|nr:S9 family peptidase [Candidatus Babeliaceae bacterium]